MVGVCYQPSSSSKRSLSDCACTLPLCITTYTVLFTLALANLPETSGIVVLVALSLVVVAQ